MTGIAKSLPTLKRKLGETEAAPFGSPPGSPIRKRREIPDPATPPPPSLPTRTTRESILISLTQLDQHNCNQAFQRELERDPLKTDMQNVCFMLDWHADQRLVEHRDILIANLGAIVKAQDSPTWKRDHKESLESTLAAVKDSIGARESRKDRIKNADFELWKATNEVNAKRAAERKVANWEDVVKREAEAVAAASRARKARRMAFMKLPVTQRRVITRKSPGAAAFRLALSEDDDQ